MQVIFSVVKRSRPFGKKSSKQKQNNSPKKTPHEIDYEDTDSDIVIDYFINILKTLGNSLVTERLTKGFRSRNVSFCVSLSKKYFRHSFQLSANHHFPFLSV